MGQIIYYLTRYYSSTGSAAAALIVSIKQPPLSLSVSNYAIIGFLLSSTQLCKTLDFCYHGSVTHAGISPYGRVKYARILDMPPSRCTVLLAATKSRTLELLAFDEYCRFDTSAFFRNIKRASLYVPKESRSIKTAIFIES